MRRREACSYSGSTTFGGKDRNRTRRMMGRLRNKDKYDSAPFRGAGATGLHFVCGESKVKKFIRAYCTPRSARFFFAFPKRRLVPCLASSGGR